MAEEEKKAEEEKAGEEKTAAPEEKKGGKPPLKLIVLALLVVLILGGGAFAWKSGMLSKMVGGGDKAKVSKKIDKVEKPEMGPIYPLDPFIVNLMEPMGKRYLKVRVELELGKAELSAEVDRRLPQFRDGILTLSKKSTICPGSTNCAPRSLECSTGT